MDWVFHGEESQFACAIFSSKERAEAWISENKVCGMLTKMPLDLSCYEWAIKNNYFTPKNDRQYTGEFIQKFTSAFLEHHHYSK